MSNPKTPGVIVEEKSTLPASVAAVPTAIPGFVGYTQQAVLPGGENVSGKPVRIGSLLEFTTIFGGPKNENFSVTLTDGPSGPIITTSPQTTAGLSQYILFYQMQMFYANGGGICYVVSVGNYSSAITASVLEGGIPALEQIDEVTLLCVPESVFVNDAGQLNINTTMLEQAARLQDRFAIIDTLHIKGNTTLQDAQDFRDNCTTADNLKYGAAYYPALETTLQYAYDSTLVTVNDNRTSPVYVTPYNKLSDIQSGNVTPAIPSIGAVQILTAANLAGKSVTINNVEIASPNNFTVVTGDNDTTAENLAVAIKAMVPSVTQVTVVGDLITMYAVVPGIAGNITITTTAVSGVNVPVTPGIDAVVHVLADKQLYNSIAAQLAKYTLDLYPSATMAGIYTRVDNDRGVWKAPANVGLAQVIEPSVDVTDALQENLNVDSTSGKSINVIRKFSGRGNLVWGARTLAGNDNEWRYINVRRLFLFAEESIKKATEFVVFEPNTSTTWKKTSGMIESFLTSLWQAGALVGSTPKDAFYVRVGLGTTMTAQDILEGRMIIEIGMAAVRPAEFIILTFMHKLQES